ncbi:MAG: branched-chain amino acid ABC transporter permease [Rhodospirillaceae bacterium]|nr:branched-chain amino acid ABC transporter permease [Rhodospirillaceae bacterium]
MYALGVAIDATLITLVLALAAFGLAIIFGLIGVINMGHGAMLTAGAYITWVCQTNGVPFLLAVLVAAVAVAVIGLVLEHVLIRHFYDRPFETLLLTWAFFLITTEVIKIIFGPEFRSVTNPLPDAITIGGIHVPAYRAAVALFALALIVTSAVVLYRTSLGIKIRGLIQNRQMAALLGLNIGLTYKLVFMAGCFMAGLAGGLITPMLSIDPYIGNVYLVRSFFVVAVGGVGQLLGGTMIGSFLIGGSETIFAVVSEQAVAQTIVFALAILVLRLRPRGVLTPR